MTTDLLVTVSGDVQTKRGRARLRFHRVLAQALADAMPPAGQHGYDPERAQVRHGQLIVPASDRRTAEPVSRVFGVRRVAVGERLPWRDRHHLAEVAAARAADDVAGRRFAVRVDRHGDHDWRSIDLEAEIGSLLLPAADRVDLDEPEVEVRIVVLDRAGWLVRRELEGPGGLPAGSQGRALVLFSGGYDSAVAAWKLMRRGCHTDLVHVRMGCAQAEHAAATAWSLWRRWGAGHDPTLWVVDGDPIRAAILETVRRSYRQVVLKRTMLDVAARLARRTGAQAIVTGDAVGQVSSQTLGNLQAIGTVELPVLRPLAGEDKDDIIREARRIGIADLAARSREVCDLAGRQVVVAAARGAVDEQAARLPPTVAERAAATAEPLRVASWRPGRPLGGSPYERDPDTSLAIAGRA